jgi:hypothetical protein
MVTASQQQKGEIDSITPRKVIVKTMTVNRSTGSVFEFLRISRTWKVVECLKILLKEKKMSGENFILLQVTQSLNSVESNKS